MFPRPTMLSLYSIVCLNVHIQVRQLSIRIRYKCLVMSPLAPQRLPNPSFHT